MSNNWTPDQLNAIQARGGSLLVSAAAGSGKTAVLVERVIGRILDDNPPVDIDRLLVVTFSKASAAEMRSRVAKRIRERLKVTPDDPHLLRQQMLLDTARISTIHSFCYELVRQNFAQLGLSHDVRIGDQQELNLLQRGALQDVLARRYAAQDDSGFLDLVELVSSSRNDREMEKLVDKLYGFLRSHPFYHQWIEEKRAYYDPSVPIEQTEWGKIIMEYTADGLAYAQGLMSAAIDMMDEPMAASYASTYTSELHSLISASETAQRGNWDQLRKALDDITFVRLPSLRGYTDENRKSFVSGCRSKVKDLIGDLREKRLCASAQQHSEDVAFLAPRISALF
ncbi:MAG: UvrD-helicase domain-containing protein, partial [Oscillospiraceae bacterium]|nr:UvrD-helicase domain-containing protein [Oscillospiraceae bacterium]